MDHMNTMLTKTCTKCGEDKPLNCYGKKSSTKLGVQSMCKVCRSIHRRSKHAANPEKQRSRTRRWKANNPDKVIATRKRFQERHPDKVRMWANNYYHNNKEKCKERMSNYYKQNKTEAVYRARMYQMARAKATPAWLSGPQRAHIKRTYKLREIVSEATGIKYHVDHIVPLQGENVCGLHVPWNLVVIPASENLGKSNKHQWD